MSASLYQLSAAYQNDAAKLSDLDLDEQTLTDTLESMSGDLEVKASNTIMVSRNLRVTANAIKEAEAQMATRRKAMEARADALDLRVFTMMQATGIERIESTYFALSIANNPPSVDVFDSLQVPEHYMRVIPETSVPDKTLIKLALKDGFEVAGARLVQSQRLSIK